MGKWAYGIVRRIAAFAPGVILALLVCEAVLRVAGLGAPLDTREHTAQEARISGTLDPEEQPEYVYEPGSRLIYTYPDNPRGYFDENNRVVGHINALSYRGPLRPKKRPEDRVRVAVLGDSFTLGYGVRDEDTFPAQMQRYFAEQDLPVEVLNFGVSGMHTGHELRYFQEYVLQFDPGIAVVTFFPNDAYREGTGQFINTQPLLPPEIQYRSYLLNFVFTVVQQQLGSRELIRHYLEGYDEDSLEWRLVQQWLEKFQRICRAHEVRFVLAIYPVLYELNEDYPFLPIHRTVREFGEQRGMHVVDLLPALLGHDYRTLRVHRTDHHPNERAHALAGAYMAKQIAPVVKEALTAGQE